MTRRSHALALALACSVLGSTAIALADGADVTATALFDEGRKLMGQKRYAEACPKLAESQRLAPSGGTLINLAECYEHVGQTASAWGAWKDVAARANAAGKADVEKNAVIRATALEPVLAKLTITLASGSDVPGLQVSRDGVALGHAEFGLQIPIDPGVHRIEATAPKKKPWSGQVEVAPKQTDASVTITLAAEDQPATAGTAGAAGSAQGAVAPPPPPPPDSAPASGSDGRTQRTLGWVGIGLGAAGLVVGSVFGITAISKAHEATNDGCSGSKCTGPNAPAGLTATTDGQHAATAADVGFIAGGVVLAAGAVLLITAPSGHGVHVAPTVGRSSAGLTLAGEW